MYRVGRTTGYAFDVSDEGFRELSESGMSLVEHSLARENAEDPAIVKKLASRYGVDLWSCHLPFRPYDEYDASMLDSGERKKMIARFSEKIKLGASVGVDKFVLHPGTPFENEAERPERLKCAMETADALAEVARAEGAFIAVEDMPLCIGRSIDEIAAIVGVNDNLRVCFDVNHLLNNTHSDFIDAFAGKIITVHFSDYDFIQEKHQFPTEGEIDWVPLISKLYGSGYTGPWIYECGQKGKSFKHFYDTAAGILKEAAVPEI